MTHLETLISEVQNKDVRTMLNICSKNRRYPRDCITDGGLEKLTAYIVELEGWIKPLVKD